MEKLDENTLKELQNSMAIEGCYLSDEDIFKIARAYEASDTDQLLEVAVNTAKQSGRPLLEVLKKVLGTKECD